MILTSNDVISRAVVVTHTWLSIVRPAASVKTLAIVREPSGGYDQPWPFSHKNITGVMRQRHCQSVDNSSNSFMLKKYCVLSLIGVYVFSVDSAAASYV